MFPNLYGKELFYKNCDAKKLHVGSIIPHYDISM